MPVTIFPCNTPQRVRLPCPQDIVPLLGQTPSWRTVFGRQDIPVFDPAVNADGADLEGYFPINAIYLQAPGCKLSPCEDATIFINDGMSRCAFWLNEATIKPPTGLPATPQVVDFAIKVANDSIPNTVFHVTAIITPGTFNQPVEGGRSNVKGLIAEVSGILCTQFELWARVRNVGVQPSPVEVRLEFIADRLGGQIFGFPGNVPVPPPFSDVPLPCCTGLTGPTGL